MVDINGKSFLQSQLASKVFQQFTGKPTGPEDQPQLPDGTPRIESVERASQQLEGSEAFAKGSDDPTRQQSRKGGEPITPNSSTKGQRPPPPSGGPGHATPEAQGRDAKSKYTVIISDDGGKLRALSVDAENADGAKEAARSNLKDGEQIASVTETPGPGRPRNNRGIIA